MTLPATGEDRPHCMWKENRVQSSRRELQIIQENERVNEIKGAEREVEAGISL